MTENEAPSSVWDRFLNRLEKFGLAELVAVFSLIIMGMGILMIVQYAQLTSFIRCQADYTEDSAIVRDKRIKDTSKKDRKLFSWIETLPPLLEQDNPKKDAKDFQLSTERLRVLEQTYEELLRTQRNNPYEDPTEICN